MRRNFQALPDQRGAVAVEFALLLPVFIMLVMGIVEFGRGYNATIELTGAVREGARALALERSAPEAQDAVRAASPSLNQQSLTFGNTASCPNGTGRASITATYRLIYNIPLVAQGTWDIARTGVMRCGG